MSEAPQGYASIGKFLSVSELRSNPKTKRWALWSDGDDYLGVISWHGAWRCYVLFPSEDTLFHAKCLTDIAVFLKKQTDEHRSSKKNHDSVVQASNAAERPARTDGKENGTPDTPPESSVQTPRGTSASQPDGEPASFLDRWSILCISCGRIFKMEIPREGRVRFVRCPRCGQPVIMENPA